MSKAEEHFNKTISWYQKRGLIHHDWFEVGQPAFKRALKIAQREKADEIFNLFRDIEVRHPCSCGRQHKVAIKSLVEAFEKKHCGGRE